MRIGVVSDTHGLLRPELLPALQGVTHILHAGDVGSADILDALAKVAPVTAIRGNIDRKGACAALPAEEYVILGGTHVYMVHDRAELSLHPAAAGVQAVVFGHSHKPLVEYQHGILYFNPGAAGPRRFLLPITIGILHLEGAVVRAEHVHLVP